MNKSTACEISAEDSALAQECLKTLQKTILGDPRPVLAVILSTRDQALKFVPSDQWVQIVNQVARFINGGCVQPEFAAVLNQRVLDCRQAFETRDLSGMTIDHLSLISDALSLHYRIHLLQYNRVAEVQRFGTFMSASKDVLWDSVSGWNSGGPSIRNTAPSAQQAAKLGDHITGLTRTLRLALAAERRTASPLRSEADNALDC